ncbi:BTB/POZ domain-containing protein KCTD15-like [Asterias amurensis]|uniref:BTB/POZ domain-containing protein KCTD15-like n=1 Tax=Asterias amurensis TaxID=7602 RepID=UPI003AB7CE4F
MDEVINLNVGGSLYTTSYSTLTRYPDSMLGAMFSGRIQSARDANGNFVIDGDGPLFRFVLNFLRRSTLNLPEDFKEVDLLAAEADFYQIEALIDAVRCLKEEKTRLEEVLQTQRERIPEMEYVEVEYECASGQWIVFANADVLKRIPIIVGSFKDSHSFKNRLTRCEENGLNLPRGQPVNRVRLFRETSQLGFGLLCTSSSGGDERSTDRWVFAREVKS